MDVSICIVNYNTADLTIKCIKSVFKHTKDLNFEVIVVDNASTDGSVKKFKKELKDKIILIENPVNRYFTGGFNDALFKAKGKYSLILNSDTYLIDNSIKIMYNFLEKNEDVGAVEGLIIDEKSNEITKTSSGEYTKKVSFLKDTPIINIFVHKFCKFLLKDYYYLEWDRKSDKEVEVICDAFMMIRTELFKSIGGFNEALKLYCTEEYLSDKIRNKNLKLVHLSKPKVYHKWSSSTSKVSKRFIREIMKTDKKIYFALKEIK
jgi:GT2 family glycosyltransferase